MDVIGKVVKKRVNAHSKSDREAIMLIVGDKEYILRRLHGHPFYDPSLDRFINKEVSCEGIVLAGRTFQANTIVLL